MNKSKKVRKGSPVAIGFYVIGIILIVLGVVLILSVSSNRSMEIELLGVVYSAAAIGAAVELIVYGALISLFGGFVEIVSDIRWYLAAQFEDDRDA